MRLKETTVYLYQRFQAIWSYRKTCSDKRFEMNRIAAELLRNSHSIEKGLSIDEKNIRLGFGHDKQREMLTMISVLDRQNDPYYIEAVKIAVAALASYVAYHHQRGYDDDCIKQIEAFLHGRTDIMSEYGGVISFAKNGDSNYELAKELFCSRHSIRDFDDSPVEEEKIRQAIRLAQTCPSACNRQGVRVYSIHANEAEGIKHWLDGTGGFEGNIQELLIVTGKMSAYRLFEHSQYIVSASMFAAYLALALHAVGLGSCIIQRNVEPNKLWAKYRNQLGIEEDEQAICVIGVGNLKSEVAVPVSRRLSDEVIYQRVRQ